MAAPYIDYKFFTRNGGDPSITKAMFPRAEMKARKTLDYCTDMRIAEHMASIPEEVKFVMVELINLGAATDAVEQISNPEPTHFSNDGVSATYGSALDARESEKAAIAKLLLQYLFGVNDNRGVPLLYRGVCV